MDEAPLKFLCISSFFKGQDFLRACKEAGNTVYLLTAKKLSEEPWPWDAIDEVMYLEKDIEGQWNMDHVFNALAYKMRSIKYEYHIIL